MKNTFKNQSGMSILQVLVMGSILSGLAVFVANSQKDTAKIIKGDRFIEDIEFFTEKVESVFMDRDYCSDIFQTTAIDINPAGQWPLFAGSELRVGAFDSTLLGNFLSLGQKFGSTGNIVVSDINLKRTSDTNGQIRIKFTSNEEHIGLREVIRIIPLKIEGTAPAIDKCFGDPSGAIADAVFRYCHGLGAFYDPDKVECIIVGVTATSCTAGQLMKGMSFNPATFMVTPVCETPSASGAVAASDCSDQGAHVNEFVPVGINADGTTNCRKLAPGDLERSNLLDLAKVSCPSKTHRLITTGGKVKVECQALESLKISNFQPVGTAIAMTKNTNLSPGPTVIKVNGANEGGTQVTPYTANVSFSLYTSNTCTTALNLATYGCTGLVTGTGPIATVANTATFPALKANCDLPSSFYMRASDGTLTSACRQVNFTSPDPPSYHLELTNLPTTVLAATNFSPQPIVTILDQDGLPKTTDSTTDVTLAAYSDAGCTVAASGSLTATPNPKTVTSGVVNFSATQHSVAGTIYVKATAAGATAACEGPITVQSSSPPVCTPTNWYGAAGGNSNTTIWSGPWSYPVSAHPNATVTVTSSSITVDCTVPGNTCSTGWTSFIFTRFVGSSLSGYTVRVSSVTGNPEVWTVMQDGIGPVIATDYCVSSFTDATTMGSYYADMCDTVTNETDSFGDTGGSITLPLTLNHNYVGPGYLSCGVGPSKISATITGSPYTNNALSIIINVKQGSKIVIDNVTIAP